MTTLVKEPETKSTLSPVEKKIRNLEKKLQQIAVLRKKQESGEKLEKTQVKDFFLILFFLWQEHCCIIHIAKLWSSLLSSFVWDVGKDFFEVPKSTISLKG